MTTTKNNEHKKLNFLSEREQSQACLNSAEHEKNQGRKVLNVPNLRFKEFQGEWEKTKIGDIAIVVGGGTPDTNTSQYWNGKIQWFTPSEIGRNKYVYNSVRTISEEGLNKSSAKLLPIGTILLSSRATVGECSINKKECTTNQGFQSLIPKENISNEFVYYLIQTKRKDLIRKSCGSTFLEISANEVRKIVVSIPTIKEQDKIAKLLSLLDDRIATQNKIIEDLKKLKSAIIEEHYKKVEKRSVLVSELGEPFNVGNLSKEDLTATGTPCVLYGELFTTYGATINHVESHTNKSDGITLSKKGDLLFPSSTTVDAVSLIAPSVINVDDVILGGDMFGIHINSDFNAQYLSYFFNHITKSQFAKYAKGSTIIHLHYKDIAKAKLSLPCLEGQNRIAKCLVFLDDKIAIESTLSDLLNSQKIYLLCQMFI